VDAAVALLESPALLDVFDEVRDELSDSPELAADALGRARITAALDAARRDRLLALAPPGRPGD
jgi:hypothetical protein